MYLVRVFSSSRMVLYSGVFRLHSDHSFGFSCPYVLIRGLTSPLSTLSLGRLIGRDTSDSPSRLSPVPSKGSYPGHSTYPFPPLYPYYQSSDPGQSRPDVSALDCHARPGFLQEGCNVQHSLTSRPTGSHPSSPKSVRGPRPP